MKRNIVGTVIIISLIFWIPISCCIHFCHVRPNLNFNHSLAIIFILQDKRLRAEQKKHYREQLKPDREVNEFLKCYFIFAMTSVKVTLENQRI